MVTQYMNKSTLRALSSTYRLAHMHLSIRPIYVYNASKC